MKNKTSNVYFLVYPHLDAVKIGKADNVFSRTQQLCHWGKPDFDKSYVVHVDASDVYKLEAALHLYLNKYKKQMNGYKGYSEFFELSALKDIPNLLNLYGFNSDKIVLKSPDDNEKNKRLEKIKLVRFKNKINRKLEKANKTVNVLNNINRCIYMMKSKGIYCRFQHETIIVESPVLFLIKEKLFRLCGISIVNMSGRDCVFIEIVRLLELFNHPESNFVNEYGFDLTFFYNLLIDCYNFLKKDLSNESELPSITINKENRLEIF
ncbi:TPA: GIY-YIG nuclease family protein [Providencia stuartii]